MFLWGRFSGGLVKVIGRYLHLFPSQLPKSSTAFWLDDPAVCQQTAYKARLTLREICIIPSHVQQCFKPHQPAILGPKCSCPLCLAHWKIFLILACVYTITRWLSQVLQLPLVQKLWGVGEVAKLGPQTYAFHPVLRADPGACPALPKYQPQLTALLAFVPCHCSSHIILAPWFPSTLSIGRTERRNQTILFLNQET